MIVGQRLKALVISLVLAVEAAGCYYVYAAMLRNEAASVLDPEEIDREVTVFTSHLSGREPPPPEPKKGPLWASVLFKTWKKLWHWTSDWSVPYLADLAGLQLALVASALLTLISLGQVFSTKTPAPTIGRWGWPVLAIAPLLVLMVLGVESAQHVSEAFVWVKTLVWIVIGILLIVYYLITLGIPLAVHFVLLVLIWAIPIEPMLVPLLPLIVLFLLCVLGSVVPDREKTTTAKT
jgi:hypothetical protein